MSPVVLLIIVIFALIFGISGLLHFLFRFLAKHSSSSSRSNNGYPEVATSDALQRQLQELFHLHDSGLDQAFIDALPVFMYEDISKVVKEPFDCAVCLCEFSEKDQLRLLPMCGHAFHINCIDTWLLSNSSCPLCRGSLFTPDLSIEYPIFDFDGFRNPQSIVIGSVPRWKSIEIDEVAKQKGLFPVRLGKFRKLGNGDDVADVGETSSSNLDARRCYSMGSYQYVVGDKNLKVALTSDQNKNTNIYTDKHTQKYTDNLACKMQACSLDPQHKIQESVAKISTQAFTNNVCVCMNHCPRINHDMKFERGLESNNIDRNTDIEGKKLSIGSKTDSYSVSKIWLWTKKNKFASSSNAQ